MLDELFVALVVAVDGMEERFGIGDVDGDWDAEAAAFFPDGIEARIVHGDELAGFVADAET